MLGIFDTFLLILITWCSLFDLYLSHFKPKSLRHRKVTMVSFSKRRMNE